MFNNMDVYVSRLKQFIISTIFLTVIVPTSYAQEIYDYYDKSPKTVKKLRTVERHHLNKGIKKIESGDINGILDFDFILRYFPNHPRVLTLIAKATIKAGDPNRARRYFDQAIELFPSSISSYEVYGVFLYKIGEMDGAIEQYQRAIELNPKSAALHYNLGLCLFAVKQYASAYNHARTAYSMGYILPGLRKKLEAVNAWKPLKQESLK